MATSTVRGAFTVLLALTFVSPALAQDRLEDVFVLADNTTARSTATPAPATRITWTAPAPAPRVDAQTTKRPGLLLPLYVGAGVLQAADFYTTNRGLAAGAHETNPAIRNGNAATTIALKAGATAAGILIAEKLWKKNKAGAILTMIATNALSAAVVANNYSVIRKLEQR